MLKEKGINKLAWAVLAFVSVMPAVSQTGAAAPSSLAQRVVDALALTGITVGPRQIEFLSGTHRARESEGVRVVSVTDSTAGTAKVKLRCPDNHDCLPFYVLVHSLTGASLRSTKLQAPPISAANAPQNVVRGGDRATLVLESPDSRLSFPVICLQSGMLGQKIRVASPDRRQVFDAEVVASGMLKGKL